MAQAALSQSLTADDVQHAHHLAEQQHPAGGARQAGQGQGREAGQVRAANRAFMRRAEVGISAAASNLKQ